MTNRPDTIRKKIKRLTNQALKANYRIQELDALGRDTLQAEREYDLALYALGQAITAKVWMIDRQELGQQQPFKWLTTTNDKEAAA